MPWWAADAERELALLSECANATLEALWVEQDAAVAAGQAAEEADPVAADAPGLSPSAPGGLALAAGWLWRRLFG